MSELNPDLLEGFIIEAKEHLASIESDLLAIEQAEFRSDRDQVDRLFRSVHSVKGGAGFFGLTTIRQLTHVMEALLERVRAGELRINAARLDVLLAGNDRLGVMLDDVQNSNAIDISQLVANLETLRVEEGLGPSEAASPGKSTEADGKSASGAGASSSPPPAGELPPVVTDSAMAPNVAQPQAVVSPVTPASGPAAEVVVTATAPQTAPEMGNEFYASTVACPVFLAGFSIDASLLHHPHQYVIRVDLKQREKANQQRPLEWIQRLLQVGHILDARIETEPGDFHSPPTAVHHIVLFGCQHPRERLQSLLGLSEDQIESVSKGIGEIVDTESVPSSKDFPAASVPAAPAPRPMPSPAPTESKPDVVAKSDIETKSGIVTAGPETIPPSAEGSRASTGMAKSATVSGPRPDRRSPGSTVSETSLFRGLDKSSTVRIDVDLLDRLMTLAGELVLVRNQAFSLLAEMDVQRRQLVQRLSAVTTDIQDAVMQTRMQPVGNLFSKLPRMVRDISRNLNKEIEISIRGSEVELDKTLLEALSDPLTHLIRNACDHGIETPDERAAMNKPDIGYLQLDAVQEGGQIRIEIRDDGRGIDPAAIRRKLLSLGLRTEADLERLSDAEVIGLITLPGLSTAKSVTDLSGRGVGMDVVRTNIEQLGGSIQIQSALGSGTTVRLWLPLTLAIIPTLIVRVNGARYAIPQKDLEELVCLDLRTSPSHIECAYDQEVYRLRERLLPVVRLFEVLTHREPFSQTTRSQIVRCYRSQNTHLHPPPAAPKRPGAEPAKSDGAVASVNPSASAAANPRDLPLLFLAVVKVGSERFCLVVDEIVGTEEIVVKPMQKTLRSLGCFAGATILGDGGIALILDVDGIARHAGISFEALREEQGRERAETIKILDNRQTVLLFRHGKSEQFAIPLPMIRRIETISLEEIERVGEKEFVNIDDVSTLVVRLDHLLEVSACVERPSMYLLLPKHVRRPVGFLLSEIIDSDQAPALLDTESCPQEGVVGSAIARGHMTLFLDIYRLMDKVDPQELHPRPSAQQKNVLLVEDTQFFRHLVRGYLSEHGFEVTTATQGAEAIEIIDKNPGRFALVISDIEMPVMDGWSLARAIRRRKEMAKTPLIALTTLNSEEDRLRALEHGFDELVVKLDREEFLEVVMQQLRPHDRSSHAPAKEGTA